MNKMESAIRSLTSNDMQFLLNHVGVRAKGGVEAVRSTFRLAIEEGLLFYREDGSFAPTDPNSPFFHLSRVREEKEEEEELESTPIISNTIPQWWLEEDVESEEDESQLVKNDPTLYRGQRRGRGRCVNLDSSSDEEKDWLNHLVLLNRRETQNWTFPTFGSYVPIQPSSTPVEPPRCTGAYTKAARR